MSVNRLETDRAAQEKETRLRRVPGGAIGRQLKPEQMKGAPTGTPFTISSLKTE